MEVGTRRGSFDSFVDSLAPNDKRPVTLSTATPLRGAYLWYDGALTLVILSERVRERVEGSPPVQWRVAREDALP